MDIIKKTVLQGFSISVLALAMVACGGSSDDSAPAANRRNPPSHQRSCYGAYCFTFESYSFGSASSM